MKKTLNRSVLLSFILCSMVLFAADLQPGEANRVEPEKKITVDKQVWASPFKSQGTGGSCSIHSVVSFLESEIYRTDHKKLELSQLHCHYNSYIEKIENALRLRDINSFRKGGQFGDVLRVIRKYGAMPYAAYEGTMKKEAIGNYSSLYGELKNKFLRDLFTKAQKNELGIEWNAGVVSNPWLGELRSILDKHIGAYPKEFTYDGRKYTPKKFVGSFVKPDFNEFVKLTSYSYIPYYESGELLVRDNWLHDNDYRCLPIDEFIGTIDAAIKSGFSAAVNIHITQELYMDAGSNYADYEENKVVDQDVRDELFDNWLTSDVHLFHLIGIAHDESGKKYYLIKDSVGEELGAKNPPILFSENYFRARALAVMVHKDGIPKETRAKLGL